VRILIYGLNFSPELTGIGKYTGELAAWLVDRGHDVRVVTAPPYYPAWNVSAPYSGWRYRVERLAGGPQIYRVPLYVPAKQSGFRRITHLLSFAFFSLPVMLSQIFWLPDIVFTIEPTFFGTPAALFVARLTGAVSWLHVQDFEIDAAFELGLLPAKGPIHSAALRIERFFCKAFSRVSSISPNMIERALTKGVDPHKTVLFPNWVNVDTIQPQDQMLENSFRRQLGLHGKIIILYSGNMGAKQGLELLVPLASSFGPDGAEANADVHFLLCGDGAFRSQLEELLGSRSNVSFLPLQPIDRLNDLLGAADIHLLPQRAGAADLVMPSKLTGMLSSGRPVIATADPGTQLALIVSGAGLGKKGSCGLVVAAEDDAALQDAVVRLVNDRNLRDELGANARRYALEHMGKQEVMEQFEDDMLSATWDRRVASRGNLPIDSKS
jgi:colanic acid biosynthesis glycosyl transferase WcaI